jgi:quercetin dioxygenase-like cupin family protein
MRDTHRDGEGMSMERLAAIKASQDRTDRVLDQIERGELQKSKDRWGVEGATAWVVYQNGGQLIMSHYKFGAHWPSHSHEGYEWLIPFSGVFEVVMELEHDTVRRIICLGNCCKIPPNVPHRVTCLKEGDLSATVAPKDEGYERITGKSN